MSSLLPTDGLGQRRCRIRCVREASVMDRVRAPAAARV